jgi:branched-chain amino acid transport system substrate-binding protein
LTGIQAPLDEPAVRGAQLAVDYLNSQGGVLGKQLEFVNLDGKSDPVTVGNVAVQLIERGAAAIITPSDFDFGGPASREAQKAGLVAMSPAASSPLFGSEALGDKQFTMSMWNTTMGAAGAEFAYNEKGFRTVYVVTDTFIDYTKSLSRYFIEHFKTLGGEVFFEDTYVQGEGDFSAQLARIQALETMPDFIYISSYMPDLGMIIRTIREAGIDVPIVGGDSYDDPGLFQAVGEQYGSDIYFTTHSWVSPDTSPQMKQFLDLYQQEYGSAPDAMWVVTGWDAVMVLTQAMEKAGSTDGAAMAKAMEETTFDLLTGKLDWAPAAEGHETFKEAALVELQGAVPSFIGWFKPETQPPP